MTDPRMPAAPPAPHLIDEIRAMLPRLQAMHRRHQEELDAHCNADGEVIEEQRAEYEEAREETAIEASDALDIVIKRLELLAALPARRAFTVALTSPGHEEGARTSLFVVHATDLDSAYRALIELPSYHKWLTEITLPGAPGPSTGDAALVAEESHPGARAPGSYSDLRHEQARILAERNPSHRTATPPARLAKPPRRSR